MRFVNPVNLVTEITLIFCIIMDTMSLYDNSDGSDALLAISRGGSPIFLGMFKTRKKEDGRCRLTNQPRNQQCGGTV